MTYQIERQRAAGSWTLHRGGQKFKNSDAAWEMLYQTMAWCRPLRASGQIPLPHFVPGLNRLFCWFKHCSLPNEKGPHKGTLCHFVAGVGFVLFRLSAHL
jgi:hypothetical protein